ncbi:MAG: N-acetylglutaminylglutamine synthetase [Pseudomonadales bacterium]
MTTYDPTARYCGWGRVLFAQTFTSPAEVANCLLNEAPDKRDIAAYVSKPHIVISYAPQQLFLDPSDMLRLDLESFDPPSQDLPDIEVRRVQRQAEAAAINDLYIKRDMVPTETDFVWQNRDSEEIVFLVAVDSSTGEVLGTSMGIDHKLAFDDTENGASLWCLAVDPAAIKPGIGRALVSGLAAHFKVAGRSRMDLSVIHDNEQAKGLYHQLGFEQVQYFSIKRKNNYNEALFIGPVLEERLNPYARIIVDEARSRGIAVEVVDAEEGYFVLSRGGKRISCRESLTEMTNALAMSRCQDKYVTHRWLSAAGINTPSFQLVGEDQDNEAFLRDHGSVVVKPSKGEQGMGISVGVSDPKALRTAIAKAGAQGDRVLLESFHPGQDLRVVVINFEVVAAAVRKPPEIIGDGVHSVRDLIQKLSRRRHAATAGESRLPIDDETERCVAHAGFTLDDQLPVGERLTVRKTANLHTGGSIEDVTDQLHPELVQMAEEAARRLDIPVVGLDMIVPSPSSAEHVIIEANERVGLANHEPQPVVERFVDFLFPLSARALQPGGSAHPVSASN